MDSTRAIIPLESADEARGVLGLQDRTARLFREAFDVAVTVRNGQLQLDGVPDRVEASVRIVEEILQRFRQTGHVDPGEVDLLFAGVAASPLASVEAGKSILRNRLNRAVAPRSAGQRSLVKAMEASEVVFAIGPAGTGKTYLAVAMAVKMLRDGAVQKLVLTRPAVEAGEKLGFLPGTFEAKVNPYLRPLYDALHQMVDPVQIKKFLENDVIEVAPLAYMRGRTLNDAYVILDEAQNTTPGQMKMFLTRMGEGSRMVVTGDVTQVDLPLQTRSGLLDAADKLRNVQGVRICRLDSSDIVRHTVVQRIVDAYQEQEDRGDGR